MPRSPSTTRFGFGDDDVRWLDADEARARIGTTDTFGAAFTRQCAALHPAKLVRGLGGTSSSVAAW